MERHQLPALPPGYRFAPTDEEIVAHYLYNKVHGRPVSTSAVIDNIDIYRDENVWIRIFERTGENALYFFTTLKKKTENGVQVERETNCGTWRSQKNTRIYRHRYNKTGDKIIKKQHIGSRRNFTYVPKEGSRGGVIKGTWVMHEYRLDGISISNARINNIGDYVICRIKKKQPKREELISGDNDGPVRNSMSGLVQPPPSNNTSEWFNVQDLEKILFDSSTANDEAVDLEDFSLGISLEDLDNF